jgi:hypothetical protein
MYIPTAGMKVNCGTKKIGLGAAYSLRCVTSSARQRGRRHRCGITRRA